MTQQEIQETLNILDSLEIEECLEIMKEKIHPQTRTCIVPLLQACDMVSAQNIYAEMSVPPFSKSAMDGYAVRASDIEMATLDKPVTLKVKGEILAGDYENFNYEPNTAVRVMTGAMIPTGYDAVVKQEDTDYGEQLVQIYKSVKPYMNYCKAGEDIQNGQILVHKNTKLEPIHIGLLASVGIADVCVYEPIKVAILSTGTELRNVGEALAEGKIYNNIAYLLAASVQRQGVKISFMQTCEDDESILADKIMEAVQMSDLVITTGAVSVGKKDIVPKVLEALGAKILFRRANIQPGTPTTASVYGDKLILSLSGNPYAAFVNFELYFWPIRALMMHNESFNVTVETAVLQSEYNKINKMRRMIRARVENGNVYIPTQVHAASVINNLQECNCMIDLEPNRKVSVGDTVTVRYIV